MRFPDLSRSTSVPASSQDIQVKINKCRSIVLRRALLSAGVSALPLPGVDLLADIGLLARVITTINQEFGLTPAQLEQLQPEQKVIAYQALSGLGSLFVGKVVTHRLVTEWLGRSGIKIVSRQSAKIVPIAGQFVAAAIGFGIFRTLGNQHIAACAGVAEQLLDTRQNASF